jgi:hypothetical protein
MIEVNAFAVLRHKTFDKGKLAPRLTSIGRQRGAQRGGEIFLEFFAGTDLGVNVKTKRRKNSARHDEHGGKIKIWRYRRHGE